MKNKMRKSVLFLYHGLRDVPPKQHRLGSRWYLWPNCNSKHVPWFVVFSKQPQGSSSYPAPSPALMGEEETAGG